ncbi:MAG: hypothetical protein GF353_11110 [Candidatus Lokiarchaeota archaeon]|nr:hypothetical protein [Candidatus Lokiarchaeota archaeon]
MKYWKRFKYFLSFDNLKFLCQYFFLALGACWLVLEFSSFFFPYIIKRDSSLFFLAILISAFWAIFKSFPPTKFSKESDTSNLIIEVKVGNLINEKSDIAIGSSNYFDTEYPNIISENSLKAQLIKRYFDGNRNELDSKIQESLDEQKIKASIDKQKAFGKNKKYPIGAVAMVPIQDRKIFLSVFSTMNCDKVTNVTRDSIWKSLCKLWDVLRQYKSLASISIPVWGAGFGLAAASRISLVQLILTSFIISNRECPVSRKLSIVICEADYNPKEMIKIRELVKTMSF